MVFNLDTPLFATIKWPKVFKSGPVPAGPFAFPSFIVYHLGNDPIAFRPSGCIARLAYAGANLSCATGHQERPQAH